MYIVYVYTSQLIGGQRTFMNKISDAKLYGLSRSATVRVQRKRRRRRRVRRIREEK